MESHPTFEKPERLLAESAWLARLARSLVDSAEDASDLAQDTFAAALAHPPAPDRPLRPWLARIARNLAINLGRNQIRRDAREEQAARPEGLPSTTDVVERFAMHRSVVEAVLALDEPYRSTLLLRYWDDLAPRSIAERLRVPVETVRTRTKRGLAMLRERLDRRHGDRGTWMAALLPVARSGSVTIASVGGGLLIMNILTKVGVAVVVAIAAAWIWHDFTASSGINGSLRAESGHTPQETAAIDEVGEGFATVSGDTRREAGASTASAVPAARNGIRCTVVDEVTGEPLVGAHAALHVSKFGVSVRARRATADSGAGGSVLLEDPRENRRVNGDTEVEVWASERAVQWISVRPPQGGGEPERIIDLGEVRLPRGSEVSGRVVAADGSTPMPGARLLMTGINQSGGIGLQGAIDFGTSDSDGAFRLERRIPPRNQGMPCLFAFTEDGLGWSSVGIIRGVEVVDDVVVAIWPSARLSVEVVDPMGSPIEGVKVEMWPKFEPLGAPYYDPWQGDDPWVKETFGARTNAQGLVTFSRLPIRDENQSTSGMQYKVTASAKGTSEAAEWLDLDSQKPGQLRLTLDAFAGVTVTGRVLDPEGMPIAKAMLSEQHPGRAWTRSDDRGQFKFVVPPTKLIRLQVEARGHASKIVERPIGTDETTCSIDIPLSRATKFEGRIVDKSDTPQAGFSVYVQPANKPAHNSEKTGEDGRFTVDGLDDEYCSLQIILPEGDSQWEGPSRMTVCSADSPLTLRMTRIERGPTRIAIELVDALTHKPLRPVEASLFRIADSPLGILRGFPVARELGFLRAEGLSAGNWRLIVRTAEGGRGMREIAISPTDLDVRLQWELSGPGVIVGRVDFGDLPEEQRPANGALFVDPYDEGQWCPLPGQALQKASRGYAPLAAADGWVFRLEDVVALQPVVLRFTAGALVARSEVIVPADGETQIVIQPKPGGFLQFENQGGRRVKDIDLFLRCAGESALRESTYSWSSDEKVLRKVSAPAGPVHWRIRYWAPDRMENDGIVTLEGDTEVLSGETTRVGVRF